jgi:hypothetical protein
MKNPKTQLGILVLSIVSLLTGAFGQLTPSGDSYTNTAASTTNYGAKTLLDVESSQTTFIQFDLSSIPSGYTSANITKATLKLYVNAVTTAGSFNVDYVNGTWTESTIDASNAPAIGTTIAASLPLTTKDKNQYILVDVTAGVQAWLSGTANDGIALVANSPLNATFDSKESTSTSHPAELDIVFAGGSGGGITGITTAAGSGLIGGGTSGTLNLSLTNACAASQVLQWSGSAWACASAGTGTITGVTAGTDLLGGGKSGNVTLSLNTAATNALYAQLAAANTFTGSQTVSGSLSATGVVSGSSYQIGSNLFAFGTYANQTVFLGFAGSPGTSALQDTATGYGALSSGDSGGYNVANGYQSLHSNGAGRGNTADGNSALYSNTTGLFNTASGGGALLFNTTGLGNTADGNSALYSNTTGGGNTGIGTEAGSTTDSSNLTGENDTALGYLASFSTGTLTNATAIGAYAEVSENNAIVLGSITNVNGCTVQNDCASTNVGIGTTAPGHLLDVAGTVAIDSTNLNNGSNFIDLTFGLNAGEGMSSSRTAGSNQYGIDIFTDFARRISIEQHGNVGIGTTSPDNLLTVNGSADKPGGGSWGTYSDGRLKNLNGSYNSGLSQVLKLNPVRYRYKSDNAMGIRDTEEHIGVVAQDVQRVIPEAVTENSKGYLLVNNDPIIWSMLNAIKEQQGEIRTLKSELRVTQRSLQRVQAQVAGSRPALVAAK